MRVDKKHLVLLAVNVLAGAGFGLNFILRKNYEFVIYVGVIIFFLAVILISYRRVRYTDMCLFGLTVWALLHMAGGAIYFGQTCLYSIIVVRCCERYPILRYDQLVHIWGFGSATLTMFCILRPLLKENLNRFAALSIVIIMAGLGVGALNEVVEFINTQVLPETNVGGYVNTSLDLIADLIGAILAMVYIRSRYLQRTE